MNILVIASGRREQVNRAIYALRDIYGDKARIILLSFSQLNNPSAGECNNIIYLYLKTKGRLFNLFYDLVPYIRLLRPFNFDKIMLIYNNSYGCGYVHLDILSLSLKAKEHLVYDTDNNILILSFLSTLKRLIKTRLLLIFLLPILLPFIIYKRQQQ